MWFAVYVQPRHEKTVASMLRNKGHEICLPIIRTRREWCDRTKWLDLPAFPGYLFCQFEAERRTPILSTPGVVGIVGAGKMPIPIGQEEIDSLVTLERTNALAEPWPYLEMGQPVRIEGGALDGLSGILCDCRKPARVVVSVALLHRSVAVEVDRERVIPVRPAPLEKTGPDKAGQYKTKYAGFGS